MSVRDLTLTPGSETIPRPQNGCSGYVTDGSRLFRVVAPLDPVVGLHTAVLEDCTTLKWRIFQADELYRLRLRSVHPEDVGRETPS